MSIRMNRPTRAAAAPPPEDLRAFRLGEVIDGADPVTGEERELAETLRALRGDPYPDPPDDLVQGIVELARSAPLPMDRATGRGPGVLVSWARKRLGRARGQRRRAASMARSASRRASRSAIARRLSRR